MGYIIPPLFKELGSEYMSKSKRNFELLATLNGVDPRVRELFLALDYGDEQLRQYAYLQLRRELDTHHNPDSVLGKILIALLNTYTFEPDEDDHPLTLLWRRFSVQPSYAIKLRLVGIEFGGEVICLYALSNLARERSLASLKTDDKAIIIERVAHLIGGDYLLSLRMSAVLTLNEFQHPSVRTYLLKGLEDSSQYLRHLAALGLEHRADESIALSLLPYLSDPDQNVAVTILKIFSKMKFSELTVLESVIREVAITGNRFAGTERELALSIARKQVKA